jgi:hypothetical protein
MDYRCCFIYSLSPCHRCVASFAHFHPVIAVASFAHFHPVIAVASFAHFHPVIAVASFAHFHPVIAVLLLVAGSGRPPSISAATVATFGGRGAMGDRDEHGSGGVSHAAVSAALTAAAAAAAEHMDHASGSSCSSVGTYPGDQLPASPAAYADSHEALQRAQHVGASAGGSFKAAPQSLVTLYVGPKLPPTVDENVLYWMFSSMGPIASVQVSCQPVLFLPMHSFHCAVV